MKKRTVLRLVSLAMFAAAVVFVIYCMCCPTLGQAIQIGPFRFGAEQWRGYAMPSMPLLLWGCSRRRSLGKDEFVPLLLYRRGTFGV